VGGGGSTFGATGGTGGDPSAGASGSGGTLATGPKLSAGCGLTPELGLGTGKLHSYGFEGAVAEYLISAAEPYDPNTPRALVFWFHGWGSDMWEQTWVGVEAPWSNEAIFVYPQGRDDLGDGKARHYPLDPEGADARFFDALYALMLEKYCIDENRVFLTGQSWGGKYIQKLGCLRGDIVRAMVPATGIGPDGASDERTGADGFPESPLCGDLGVMMINSTGDTTAPIESARNGRDYWTKRNGCAATSTPFEPTPCVSYDGCAADMGVAWCEFDGGHEYPSWAPQATYNFLSLFE
jgi:polyhydroxybutyrate depolymerase